MRHLFLALSAMLSVSTAVAETKLGYVDVEKALQATSAGRKAHENLEVDFKKRKEALEKRRSDIEKMSQDLQKSRPVMSEESLQKKQLELQDEMAKFQKDVGENQIEIQKRQEALLQPLFKKMKTVIDKVAQEKGLSLVVENRAQFVLYAANEIDLTNDVIKAFEKEKP